MSFNFFKEQLLKSYRLSIKIFFNSFFQLFKTLKKLIKNKLKDFSIHKKLNKLYSNPVTFTTYILHVQNYCMYTHLI